MKKLGIAICLLFLNKAYALPVGNPIEASLFYDEQNCSCACFCDFFDVSVGFYGNYVFNRHMETVHDRDIDTTKLFTNAGYLGVTFCKWLEVFTTLGVSRLALNTSLGSFNDVDPHPLFEIESGTSFSYSVGGRVTLFE